MAEIVEAFKNIVGEANVLTKEMDTAYYRSGFRCGFGGAKAVVALKGSELVRGRGGPRCWTLPQAPSVSSA